eukprot:4027879-Pyramimonas_sp.AAC.1
MQRLQPLHPGTLGTRPSASTLAHGSSQLGRRCNCGVGSRGHHALTREVGGGALRWNDKVRDWLAA